MPEPESPLQVLGVHADAEAVYRAVLCRAQATVADLSGTTERSIPEVEARVAELESLGLVHRLPGRPLRLRATRPDVALEVLVSRRQEELARAQLLSRELLALVPAEVRHSPEDIIEVLVGRPAIAARFEQLLTRTRDELLVLDRPPYVADSGHSESTVKSLLATEVTVRGIYAPEALELDGALAAVQDAVRSGEQSRVHPAVPLKLAISDRQLAILPVESDDAVEAALCIRPSGLMEALVGLFELLWEPALPVIVTDEEQGASTEDRDLAALLASGAKDDVIARHLGVSARTLSRRIADLLDDLHVRTRFQAGVRAAQLGWLSAEEDRPDDGLVQ